MTGKRIAALLVLAGCGLISARSWAQGTTIKKVNVADILNKCCYQELVQITGTMSQYELNATDNTYFYYVRDDFGSPIKVTAGGKPVINPGERVKVTGFVALSPTDGYYLTQQTMEKVGNKTVIYMIIGSAVVLAILIFIIIFFLVSSSGKQKELEEKRLAADKAREEEIRALRAQLEMQREAESAGRRDDADARARQAAAQIKPRTMIKESPAAGAGALAPRYQRAYVKIVQGPEAGATLEVKSPLTTIGREDDNDIVLRDSRVSSRHARIEVEAGTFYLTDSGSTNGTYLNGNRLSTRAVLIDGYQLRLGGVELAFIGKV